MSIRGIVFDIGGVLEITPRLGVNEKWEEQLQLEPGGLSERLRDVWRGGSIGTLSETEVHQAIGERLQVSDETVQALMDDIWEEYLGTLNVELADYFRSLRPTYQTAILSNSFVGAREREDELYGFGDICDFIVYSHEVGMSKPDPRIYEKTCELLNLRPEEVIFLDDVPEAVKEAQACGLHGILFESNTQAIAAIEACIVANAAE